MNHAHITAEAIRFRLSTIRRPVVRIRTVDIGRMADAALNSGTPEVAAALRRIAAAWRQAGMEIEEMAQPWTAEAMDIFKSRPDLVDALDDILLSATHYSARAA